MTPSVLVAGIGNIFNRDDGFGVAVAAKLERTPLPGHVRVRDFGIRGFDLVLALLDGYDLIIFVDTAARGGLPGTLYAIEPELPAEAAGNLENAHGLDPVRVLESARGMGAPIGRVLVIACEPATLADDTGEIELSDPVKAAVDPAIEMIHSFIADFENRKASTT